MRARAPTPPTTALAQNWRAAAYAYAYGRQGGLTWFVSWDLWQREGAPLRQARLYQCRRGLLTAEIAELEWTADGGARFGGRGQVVRSRRSRAGTPAEIRGEIRMREAGRGRVSLRAALDDGSVWLAEREWSSVVYLQAPRGPRKKEPCP